MVCRIRPGRSASVFLAHHAADVVGGFLLGLETNSAAGRIALLCDLCGTAKMHRELSVPARGLAPNPH